MMIQYSASEGSISRSALTRAACAVTYSFCRITMLVMASLFALASWSSVAIWSSRSLASFCSTNAARPLGEPDMYMPRASSPTTLRSSLSCRAEVRIAVLAWARSARAASRWTSAAASSFSAWFRAPLASSNAFWSLPRSDLESLSVALIFSSRLATSGSVVPAAPARRGAASAATAISAIRPRTQDDQTSQVRRREADICRKRLPRGSGTGRLAWGVRTAETIPHGPGSQASPPNRADTPHRSRVGRDGGPQAAGCGPWHASRVNTTPTSLLLDSPSLVYRAFFALPRSIRDPSGQSVNAAHGYLDMVSRLLTDLRPSAVTHVFDADWRPKWRVDAYPGYKAKRAEDPPELPGQFPIIRSVLDAAGLPVAEAAGTEADDVIGTLATAAGPEDRVAIVTGDRDLFQLRGTSDMARMDEAGVRAKCGVPPSRYVDFAILRGDPSDGLPGVAGVGEKTAARLVSEYPTLDDLVAARDRLPPRVAAALAGAGE